MKTVNLAGFGLIGLERAQAVAKLRTRGYDLQLGSVYDPNVQKLARGAVEMNFKTTGDFEELMQRPCDLLVIACPHDVASAYAIQALQQGIPVLLEKPMGRNLAEAKRIVQAVQKSGQLQIGFNYRYMPGIQALLADVAQGRFGKLISLNAQLGHGGSPEDKRSWKLDPEKCGGGALLDPGIHLLDLCAQLVSPIQEVMAATTWRGFWETGIEEEAHVLLRQPEHGIICNLQMSIVRWRSRFYLEVVGEEGYGVVSGRGRSYGVQTYLRGKRWGWQDHASQAASEEIVLTSDCADSFADELLDYLGMQPAPGASRLPAGNYLEVMKLYQTIQSEAEQQHGR